MFHILQEFRDVFRPYDNTSETNVLFVNIVKHYQESWQDLSGCCLLRWEAFGMLMVGSCIFLLLGILDAETFSRSNFLR